MSALLSWRCCVGTLILAPETKILFSGTPGPGLELTYEDSARELERLLLLIGESALAHGLHSLRRGGATAVANDDAGGSLTAGFMGHWASNAEFGYMFALRQKVERAALAIGRVHRDAIPVAVRPGPVNSYSRWPCQGPTPLPLVSLIRGQGVPLIY